MSTPSSLKLINLQLVVLLRDGFLTWVSYCLFSLSPLLSSKGFFLSTDFFTVLLIPGYYFVDQFSWFVFSHYMWSWKVPNSGLLMFLINLLLMMVSLLWLFPTRTTWLEFIYDRPWPRTLLSLILYTFFSFVDKTPGRIKGWGFLFIYYYIYSCD